jgi:NAD(P)H dehydrogenase (quinone)
MSKILVTGASGHLGGLIVKHLLETQKVAAADLVVGSRDPAKLASLVEKGIEARKVDFDDKAGLAAAFSGIDNLLIVSTDELVTPGKRLVQHKAAVEAATAANVGRIFYTSLPQAENSPISFAPDHFGTEQAIKASGLAYTILRNSWYMENLFLGLPAAFASGHWYTSAGDGKTAYIAREDVARATAAALAKPASGNVVLTLSGEKAYGTAEIAALARAATGKPLEIVSLTDGQLTEGMIAAGLPAPIVPTFVSFDTATREGKLGLVTSDARDLIGAPLKTLESFIEENAAALAG